MVQIGTVYLSLFIFSAPDMQTDSGPRCLVRRACFLSRMCLKQKKAPPTEFRDGLYFDILQSNVAYMRGHIPQSGQRNQSGLPSSEIRGLSSKLLTLGKFHRLHLVGSLTKGKTPSQSMQPQLREQNWPAMGRCFAGFFLFFFFSKGKL